MRADRTGERVRMVERQLRGRDVADERVLETRLVWVPSD